MTALKIDHLRVARCATQRGRGAGDEEWRCPGRRGRHFAHEAEAVALAVEETITTPSPGFGHGRLGDVAAVATFLLTSVFHVF